jgi:hypothetical protein
MMEAVRTSETSFDNHSTRQYNPEDSSEHHTIFSRLFRLPFYHRFISHLQHSNAKMTGDAIRCQANIQTSYMELVHKLAQGHVRMDVTTLPVDVMRTIHATRFPCGNEIHKD